MAISKWSKPKRRIEHPDPEKRGLYLIAHPTGRLTWAMRFRDVSGAVKKYTLGDYSPHDTGEEPIEGAPLTIAGAHELAAKIDARRQRGIDLFAERDKRKHEAARINLEDNLIPAAFDVYIKHGRRAKVAKGVKRDKGWANTAQVLGLKYNGEDVPTLIPGGLAERWQIKRADQITADDVFLAMQDARLKGIPGRPVRNSGASEARAREMAAALGGCFRWLTGQRRVPLNPCSGLERPRPSTERQRVLNFYLDRRRGDELRWFWAATGELEVPYRNFVRTLVLTGQRRDEVSGMRAEELNDDCSEWVIPAQRVKNGREHRVPLPKLASDIVRASIGDRPGRSGFVFTADSRQITGYSVLKRKLDAKMMTIALAENASAKIDRWTLHDLRRTAATAMIELGVASNVVEAILNHVSGSRAGVAGVYDRSQLPGPKRDALEKWARHVELVVSGKTAKVVPMRKAN